MPMVQRQQNGGTTSEEGGADLLENGGQEEEQQMQGVGSGTMADNSVSVGGELDEGEKVNSFPIYFQNVLLDLLGGSPVHTAAESRAIGLAPVAAPTGNNMDLLDLLGGIGDPSPVMTSNDPNNNGALSMLGDFGGSNAVAANNLNNNGLLDNSLFGGGGGGGNEGFTNNNTMMGSGTGSSSLIAGFLDDLTLSGASAEPEGEVSEEKNGL